MSSLNLNFSLQAWLSRLGLVTWAFVHSFIVSHLLAFPCKSADTQLASLEAASISCISQRSNIRAVTIQFKSYKRRYLYLNAGLKQSTFRSKMVAAIVFEYLHLKCALKLGAFSIQGKGSFTNLAVKIKRQTLLKWVDLPHPSTWSCRLWHKIGSK